MKRLLAVTAALILAGSCNLRDVECEEEVLSDGTPCMVCNTHNNLSGNDSNPSADCSEKRR